MAKVARCDLCRWATAAEWEPMAAWLLLMHLQAKHPYAVGLETR